MSNIDYKALDTRLLLMFISVYDQLSVTKAANELGVTQSTVSHGLNRLRKIVKDELFVNAGRSIVTTPKADLLVDKAREIISSIQDFASPEYYDPSQDTATFTIAANDYEIETVIKPLLKKLREQAPSVSLHIAQATSQSQWAALLRSGEVDFVLSPELHSNEPDIIQSKLFSDREVCFYDPAYQSAPKSLQDYCAMPHAIIAFDSHTKTDIDRDLAQLGISRKVVASASNFSALAALIKGTDIIAAMPSRFSSSLFKEFEQVALPFEISSFDIVKIWHNRNRHSQRHIWFKNLIQ